MVESVFLLYIRSHSSLSSGDASGPPGRIPLPFNIFTLCTPAHPAKSGFPPQADRRPSKCFRSGLRSIVCGLWSAGYSPPSKCFRSGLQSPVSSLLSAVCCLQSAVCGVLPALIPASLLIMRKNRIILRKKWQVPGGGMSHNNAVERIPRPVLSECLKDDSYAPRTPGRPQYSRALPADRVSNQTVWAEFSNHARGDESEAVRLFPRPDPASDIYFP